MWFQRPLLQNLIEPDRQEYGLFSIGLESTHEFSIDDPIFDSLKTGYSGEFEAWFAAVQQRNLSAVVARSLGDIAGLLIFSNVPAAERLEADEPLPVALSGHTLSSINMPRHGTFRIHTFVINDKARGLTLGPLLMEFFFSYMRGEGAERVYLTLRDPNEKRDFLDFLRKQGFYMHPNIAKPRRIYVRSAPFPVLEVPNITRPMRPVISCSTLPKALEARGLLER